MKVENTEYVVEVEGEPSMDIDKIHEITHKDTGKKVEFSRVETRDDGSYRLFRGDEFVGELPENIGWSESDVGVGDYLTWMATGFEAPNPFGGNTPVDSIRNRPPGAPQI